MYVADSSLVKLLARQLVERKSFVFSFILMVAGICYANLLQADSTHLEQPSQLKPLYLETSLVSSGAANIVVVAPSSRYEGAVKVIRDRVMALSGVRLMLVDDQEDVAITLGRSNVIVLGNMHSNRFIETLYRKWYVFLDSKYPGVGGYIVRSLHNPLGTGRNVIFVGGSDDAGVLQAAQVFANTLVAGDSLTVGRLAIVQLGGGLKPPVLDLSRSQFDWNVLSWRDSWRTRSDGSNVGYPPATYFGWNPISIAGFLYYMTGDPAYMAQFKALALPNPANVPTPLVSSEAIFNPLDPLVDNYHYNSHLVDWVFDLIEESPLLNDAERLAITTKLFEHQLHYDPTSTYRKSVPTRHTSWQLMGIYTGSRYFATYYPDPIWQRRLDNVRASFANFLINPSWGERDTLNWVSTSIEPVFEFFLVDGYGKFVDSGMAETMIDALPMLDDGTWRNDYNQYVAMSLLHKASYMLNTPRYFDMARKLRFDSDVFRVGQSYWWKGQNGTDPPPPGLRIYRLPRSDWETSGRSIDLNRGFQLLSYHEGFSARDDYILLDGYYGGGRSDFHVNTLYRLRLQGKDYLAGYGNDVDILRDGLVEKVGRAATLEARIHEGNVVYIETAVKNTVSAQSRRHILYIGDELTLVVDRITALDSGDFDITTSWQLAGDVNYVGTRDVTLKSGAQIIGSDPLQAAQSSRWAQQLFQASLTASESVSVAHLFARRGPKHTGVTRIRPHVFSVAGTHPAVVALGPVSLGSLAADASFLYIDNSRIIARQVRSLTLGAAEILKADTPVDVIWDLANGQLVIESGGTFAMTFTGSDSPLRGGIAMKAGRQSWPGIVPAGSWFKTYKDSLMALSEMGELSLPTEKQLELSAPQWKPRWTLDLGQLVTKLALPRNSVSGPFWVATADDRAGSQLWRIDVNGSVLGESTSLDSPVTSIWAARSAPQAAAFSVLAGLRDDTLAAISPAGTLVWKVKASIHPSFMVGSRYEAPWFTDPALGHTGIFSLLVGDLWGEGIEEIVLARPNTVEFRSLNGSLVSQVRTEWGDNRSLSFLSKRGGSKPVLLVGKKPTGQPKLSMINSRYESVSDSAFGAVGRGKLDMHAWLQRGVGDVAAADLNGDGIQEVIYTLSGHWNELRVYDGATESPMWSREFGPGQSGADFMRGLAVTDIDGDGNPDIVVANSRGWVHVFSGIGNRMWQKRLPSAVSAIGVMEVPDDGMRIVVGLEDGAIVLLRSDGEIDRHFESSGAIIALDVSSEAVLAGTVRGQVVLFNVAVDIR